MAFKSDKQRKAVFAILSGKLLDAATKRKMTKDLWKHRKGLQSVLRTIQKGRNLFRGFKMSVSKKPRPLVVSRYRHPRGYVRPVRG